MHVYTIMRTVIMRFPRHDVPAVDPETAYDIRRAIWSLCNIVLVFFFCIGAAYTQCSFMLTEILGGGGRGGGCAHFIQCRVSDNVILWDVKSE